MCNSCNDPFHGLDDDLSDVFGGPLSADELKAGQNLAASQVERLHTENCPSCRGTGRYTRGYFSGACFKCKGTGKLHFKTSYAERAKAAAKRTEKADEKRVQLQAARAQWIRDNADDFEWMRAKSEGDRPFEFAQNMYDALMQYGSLTEKQHATVTRLRLADAERKAAFKAEAAQRAANAPVVNIAAIETAFATAKDNGIKKPKMKLAGFKFSEAPAHGRNAGALYVVRVEDDQYLGKVQDGRFVRVRECSADTEAEVIAVASDPHNAAIAYGRRTGNCAICGRELTNHASIDLGIGPICAAKYGWM